MIGTTEWANRSGRARRGTLLETPVAIVATVRTRATPAEKAMRARVSGTTRETSHDWTSVSQAVDSRKESKAVLPNSTPTTATSPGRGTVVSRLASGLRSTSLPSRRPQIDSLATSEE